MRLSDKEIRFIDSSYKELFRIPDGGRVKITADNGHSFEATCKYIDDYHFYLDNSCLHICQFAEIMEHNGSKCEPITPLYELETVTEDELSLAYSDDKAERGNIGYLRGDFDRGGNNFYSNWFENNRELKSNDFTKELNKVIDYFRETTINPVLKDRSSMQKVCREYDNLTVNNGRSHIFKTITPKHTYYIRCTPHRGEYDFYVYCYENTHLQRYTDIRYVEQNYECTTADKFYKTENGFTEMYYNPDATAGGQVVQVDFDVDIIKDAAKYKKPSDFFDHIGSVGRQYLIDAGTPEFKAAFDNFKNTKADFEGDTKKTMHSLMKAAGIKPPNKDMER